MPTTAREVGRFNFQEDGTIEDPDQASEAITTFIWGADAYETCLSEKGRAILLSPELLTFIARGFRKHLKKGGDLSAWTGTKRGRPKSDSPSDCLSMLAWYRFHLDPKFNSIPKTSGDGRYIEIADSFNVPDKQAIVAEDLSKRAKGLEDVNSESSVKRAIRSFQHAGLTLEEHTTHNQIQLDKFCRFILFLSDRDIIEERSKEIYECWKRNKPNEKVQK